MAKFLTVYGGRRATPADFPGQFFLPGSWLSSVLLELVSETTREKRQWHRFVFLIFDGTVEIYPFPKLLKYNVKLFFC